ncbi:DNA sulfur modification protein DndB [Caulobacter segnis]|uniref:DNA sulfur modification protein DndB n=1 Tax=Caulobacter segnis TaxID=88688 RepID=UPI0024105E7E|nr:DNA sulfur modification protein DndB [Caulobacter segnis]MDG2521351.1 DNA sulfur modification protein DndB [Caulobacter segnis]
MTDGKRYGLDQLKRTGGRGTVDLPMISGFNMGNGTLNITMPMGTFREVALVANEARILSMGEGPEQVAQRQLIPDHARKLALYILRGLLAGVKSKWRMAGRHVPDCLTDILNELGEGPYQALQPFTANIRNIQPGELEFEDTPAGTILHLHKLQRLFVVDGQHRLRAGEMVHDWLSVVITNAKYPKKGLWIGDTQEVTSDEMEVWAAALTEFDTSFTIDVTVHLGLDAGQERQLFHDLNVLGKKPSAAQALSFDAANPVNKYASDRLAPNGHVHGLKVVDAGHKKSGTKLEDAAIFRDDLVNTCAILFRGAFNQSGITPMDVMGAEDYADNFWRALSRQPGWAEAGRDRLTLLAQPTVIKGMAFLVRSFHNGEEARDEPAAHGKRDAIIDAIANGAVDFSHENPLWRVYLMSHEDREEAFPGISEYITPDAVLKPYGTWDDDARRLQLGPNTRDISRYLADLVRYQLRDQVGLEPRPGLISLKRKLAEAEAQKLTAA